MEPDRYLDEWLTDTATVNHGRATLADAENAKVRVEVSITWQHGVTRDEVTSALSVSCENVKCDLAAAEESAFNRPTIESETL